MVCHSISQCAQPVELFVQLRAFRLWGEESMQVRSPEARLVAFGEQRNPEAEVEFRHDSPSGWLLSKFTGCAFCANQFVSL